MRASFISAIGRATAASVLLVSAAYAPLAAQQANASAEAMGLDNNFVAKGQGVDAVAWNPAMLGMSRNPAFSVNIGALQGIAGLDPVSYNDFVKYAKNGNTLIPDSTRHTWLNDVTASGGENGHQSASVGLFGIGIGHVAFQLSSTETMQTKLNPDAFQAIMFGNAGATGSLQTLNFAGSDLSDAVFTTAGFSIGLPTGHIGHAMSQSTSAFGVTIKYVLGNFLVIGQDNGSAISSDSVDLNFPIVVSNTDSSVGRAGSGIGADIGYAWRSSRLTFSAVAQNVVNTFSWDITKLESRPGTASFNGTTNTASFDQQAFTAAPQSLQDRVAAYRFKPALLAGIAYELNRKTTLTADLHDQFGSNSSILIGPKQQVGAGLEFRGIPFIPLRVGASVVTGGWSASGGFGIALGPYELGLAALVGHRDGGTENGVMISAFTLR